MKIMTWNQITFLFMQKLIFERANRLSFFTKKPENGKLC